MSFNTFAQSLAKVPKNVEIVFAGMAEPFLNPDAVSMVYTAIHEGYKVGIYTTLEGLSVSELVYIYNLPFSFFCLHLPDADGIMKLKITEKYLKKVEFATGIKDIQLMVIGKLHPEVEKITGPVKDGSHGLFSRAGNLKTLAINKKKGVLECSACGPKIDHNILLPNGDVLLCCMDYSQEHVIGNLLTDSYEDLFKSPEYLKVMEGLKDENSDIICRKCEVSKAI